MLKNKFNSIKDSVSSGYDSVVATKEDIKESVSSGYDSVIATKEDIKESVSNGYDSVVSTKREMKDSISEKIDNVSSSVEVISGRISTGVSVITSTVNVVSKTVVKTVSYFLAFSGFLFELGITVAAITAPVPTLIGLGIIYLITEFILDVNDDIDKTKESKKAFRAITALKKYGAIPKNAIVKNDIVNMNINSETGSITGVILKGEFKDKNLEEIDNNSIKKLIDSLAEKESKDLLSAYLKFRVKKERNNVIIETT